MQELPVGGWKIENAKDDLGTCVFFIELTAVCN